MKDTESSRESVLLRATACVRCMDTGGLIDVVRARCAPTTCQMCISIYPRAQLNMPPSTIDTVSLNPQRRGHREEEVLSLAFLPMRAVR